MPRSRQMAAYPMEYLDLYQSAIDNGKIVIDLQTNKEAIALRFDLYGFRKAMENEGHFFWRQSLSVEITLSGVQVMLSTRETTPAMSAIRSALAKNPPKETEAPHPNAPMLDDEGKVIKGDAMDDALDSLGY